MGTDRGPLYDQCRQLVFNLAAQFCDLNDESWTTIETDANGGVALQGHCMTGTVHIDLTRTVTINILLDLAEYKGVTGPCTPHQGAEFRFVPV